MRTLAHLSDIHFGKISDPRVVAAVVDEVNADAVDLVVVSGDLTQRARRHEFRAARAMLDAFERPVVVVPGNHDVRAWWHHPIDRLWHPSKRFRRFISDDTTPSFVADGLAVFGLDSAHGLTIKGGKIRARHVADMEAFFAEQPAGAFRVLTLHHHLLELEALGRHDISRRAHLALDAAHRARVDLVLCGHLHRSHVERVEVATESAAVHGLVIASAGTATSSRGRGSNTGVNFYNRVEVSDASFTVVERRFDSSAGRFEEARRTTFERETA